MCVCVCVSVRLNLYLLCVIPLKLKGRNILLGKRSQTQGCVQEHPDQEGRQVSAPCLDSSNG